MRNVKKILAGAAVAALLGIAGEAMASPLINLAVLGRKAGTADAFSGSLQLANLAAGDRIEYEVVAYFSDPGTQNLQGATTRTVPNPKLASDGLNGLKFHIYEDPSGTQLSLDSAPTFGTGWGLGVGASTGTATARSTGGMDLLNVRPVQSSGVFVGGTSSSAAPVLVLSGLTAPISAKAGAGALKVGFTAPADISTSTAASFRNNSTAVSATLTTEKGTDPMVGLFGLSLVDAAPPGGTAGVGSAATNAATSPAVVSIAGSGGKYVSPVVDIADVNKGSIQLSFSDNPGVIYTMLQLVGTDVAGAISRFSANPANAGLTVDSSDPNFGLLHSNYDGKFGGGGFNLLLKSSSPGTGGGFLNFDFTGDGSDVKVSQVAAVPEPAGLSLLGLGAFGLLARKRRK